MNMAFYPYGEVKLMEDYELAKAYSWDLPSALKLVKVEMHMKLQEFNDRILHAVHTTDITDYEKFHDEFFKKEAQKEVDTYSIDDEDVEEEGDEVLQLGLNHEEGNSTEEEEGTEEVDQDSTRRQTEEEVFDEMRDKVVDYLDLIMPNLSLKLPNIEHDVQHKKVQFSDGRKKSVSGKTWNLVIVDQFVA